MILQRIVGGHLFLAVLKRHRLENASSRQEFAAWLPLIPDRLRNQLSCVWVSRLGLNMGGLGLFFFCCSEVIFPQVTRTEVSLVLKICECVWSETYSLLPITHGWRKAQWLASLAAQDNFALSGLHGSFRIIKPSSGSLNNLGCAHSSHVKGNCLKR